MSRRTIISTCLRCLALGSSILDCSSGHVDLGGGTVAQEVQRGSRCSASTIVADDVRVDDQDDLDALLGCEEIHGDLSVSVFEGTDLRPLRQLRVVDGVLDLGVMPGFDVNLFSLTEDEVAVAQAKVERAQQIVEAGWLPSLEGLESLRSVGSLELLGLAAPDLRAFESLRVVGSTRLVIAGAKNLIDLRGLEQVPQFTWLVLSNNPSLESLDGLQVASNLQQVDFQRDPRLADIGALSGVESVEGMLYLLDTGVPNLDALSHLNGAFGGVALGDNAQLTQVDALATRLTNVSGGLLFENNPKLERLPAFPNLFLLDSFRVRGNAELATISLNFSSRIRESNSFNDETNRNVFQEVSSGTLEIEGNPKLETLTFESGFRAAQWLYVTSNAGLARLDLGSLQSLDHLNIRGNANLTDVSLGELQTVTSLSVTYNPSLDPSQLRNVRSLNSEFSGNADDPAP